MNIEKIIPEQITEEEFLSQTSINEEEFFEVLDQVKSLKELVGDFINEIKGQEEVPYDRRRYMFDLYGTIYKTYRDDIHCHSCVIQVWESINYWYDNN